MTGNVGDPLLFYELENQFNTISGKEYAWYHRRILSRISKFEIWCWNHFAKGLIVGGHGLLMVDTGRNENSGWQLNVSLQKLNHTLSFSYTRHWLQHIPQTGRFQPGVPTPLSTNV